jgi:peptide/nickel transport system permease protein
LTAQSNTIAAPLAAPAGSEPVSPPDTVLSPKKRSYLRKHPAVTVGGGLLLLMILIAVFAPLLWTVDPTAISTSRRTRVPSELYWFGTDMLGRDIYSRVTYGARVSLLVGFSVAFLASVIGLAVGLFAGFVRWADGIVMRVIDGMMSIPPILLAIALMALTRGSVQNVIIAITIAEIPRVARLVRSVVLSLREQPYVEAAISQGARVPRIIFRHILPNTVAPMMVQATYICASAMIVEAILSFIGAGVPPSTPSWGNIMAEGGRSGRSGRISSSSRRCSSRSPFSRSTCWATACATPSIHGWPRACDRGGPVTEVCVTVTTTAPVAWPTIPVWRGRAATQLRDPRAACARVLRASRSGVEVDHLVPGNRIGDAKAATEILQCVAKAVERCDHLGACGLDRCGIGPFADQAIGAVAGFDDVPVDEPGPLRLAVAMSCEKPLVLPRLDAESDDIERGHGSGPPAARSARRRFGAARAGSSWKLPLRQVRRNMRSRSVEITEAR